MRKLNPAKVRKIRERYIPGTGGGHPVPGNVSALAREFGIHKRTVLSIVTGETWGWVE